MEMLNMVSEVQPCRKSVANDVCGWIFLAVIRCNRQRKCLLHSVHRIHWISCYCDAVLCGRVCFTELLDYDLRCQRHPVCEHFVLANVSISI